MKIYLKINFLKWLKILSLGLSLYLFSACSHHDDLQAFNQHYYYGDTAKAYKYAKNEAGSDGDVLWNLQAGISGFESNQKDSMNLLEGGEILFSKYEAEGLLGGIFGNVGAVIINENVKSYRGNIYEGVAFNYYKALNAMSSGNNALARVEFNRANDRQRRAKDYFYKDIQNAQNAQNEENAKDSNLANVDAQSQSLLRSQYSNLARFKAYNSFINPAVSYVSALFFMLESDYAKAMDLYKESYGMTESSAIDSDLAIMQKRKNGADSQKYTWLIIEDGRSAYKEEFSLNIPSYLVSGSVLHIGVSFPVLKEGYESAKKYRATSGSNRVEASEIANLDSVIANEYEKQLPFIITRALASATLKATTQAILGDQLGGFGAIGGMLYSMITNSADIRIATALPKKILALNMPNTKNFTLQADKRKLYEVRFSCANEGSVKEKSQKIPNVIILCEKNDNIIYFRSKGQSVNYKILKGGL